MGTLYECLKEAKLERYYPSFRAHGITKSEGLLRLTVHDCSAFGIHLADDKRRLVELISIVKAVHNVERDSYSTVNRSTSSKSPRKRGRSPAYSSQQVTGRAVSSSSDVRVRDRLRPNNSSHNLSAAGAALLDLISDEDSSETRSDDSGEHSDYEPAVKHSVTASVSKAPPGIVKKAPVGKVTYGSGYNYGVPGAGASTGARPKSGRNSRIHEDKIRVCVRKRPLSKKELKSGEEDLVQTASTTTLIVSEPKQAVDLTAYTLQHEFIFDEVFEERCTNEDVYIRAARPLISCVFDGGSATCFAYGQTGAGKTHTMIGSREVPGLYLLAAHDIFSIIETGQYGSDIRVWVSFFEIYCGQLFDLLNKRNRLHAREDGSHRVCIAGLTETEAKDEQSLMQVLEYGNSVRSKGATGVNPDSSRSHAVLQMEIRDRQEKRLGRISFIDLAGSERASDSTDTDKQTRMEGAEINQSLLALKECIRSIDQESRHKPFRQSKLTHILKDSFIGNSRTCMIANVSPASSSCEHTLNTLRYADRVKELRRTPNSGSTSRSMNVAMSNILMNIPASGPSLFQPSNILCSSTPMRQNTRQFTNRNSSAEIQLDPSETPIRGPGVRRKTSSAATRAETKTSQSVRSSVASHVTKSAVVRHVAPNTTSNVNVVAHHKPSVSTVNSGNTHNKQSVSSNSESDQTESDSCNMTGPQKPLNLGGREGQMEPPSGRSRTSTYTRRELGAATHMSQNIPVVKSTDTENDFPTTDFNNEDEMNDLNRTDGKNNVAASTPVFPIKSERHSSDKEQIRKDKVSEHSDRGSSMNQYSSVSASVPVLRKKVYSENSGGVESGTKDSGNNSGSVTQTHMEGQSKATSVKSGGVAGTGTTYSDSSHKGSTTTSKTKDLENQRIKDMRSRPTLQIPEPLSSFDDDMLFDTPSVDQRLWTPRTPSENSGTQPRIPQDPSLQPEIPAVLPAKSTELTTFSQRSPRWQFNKPYSNTPSQQPSGFRPEPVKNDKQSAVQTNNQPECNDRPTKPNGFRQEKQTDSDRDKRNGLNMKPKNRNTNAYGSPNDQYENRFTDMTSEVNGKGVNPQTRSETDVNKGESKQPISANWFTTPADHETHVSQSVSRPSKHTGHQQARDRQAGDIADNEETDLKKIDDLSLGQRLSERDKNSHSSNALGPGSSYGGLGKSSSLLHEHSKKPTYSGVITDYKTSDFSQPGYFSDSAARPKHDSVKHRVVHSPVNARQAFNTSPVIKDMPSSMNDSSTRVMSPASTDGTASPVSSRGGNGAVKTEKLTAGAMFSPIHPQPVTNSGQTKTVGAALSKDIVHPTPVSRSSSSSETRLDRASSSASDVIDLKAQLISSHEDQLAAVTSLCKQEMKLLLSAKAGNKSFEDYMKKVGNVLSQKISAIQLLQDQIMAYQLSTQDSA